LAQVSARSAWAGIYDSEHHTNRALDFSFLALGLWCPRGWRGYQGLALFINDADMPAGGQ